MDRPDSSLKKRSRLHWLTVILVGSNIGVGLLSVHFLQRIDQRYSELVSRSVPVLGDLQELTAGVIKAMRATNPVLAFPPADRTRALQEDAQRREHLLASTRSELGDQSRNELQAAGAEFTRLGGLVLQTMQGGPGEAVLRIRNEALWAAFDRYVAATTRAAEDLEIRYLQENQTVSNSANQMSNVIYSVGGWPIVLLLSLLLLLTFLVVVLMLLFRGREMGDQP